MKYTRTSKRNIFEMNNKALSRLIFAAGDYVALVFAAYMALKIRNMIMTYSVYHVNTEYILFGLRWFLCHSFYIVVYTPKECLLIK